LSRQLTKFDAIIVGSGPNGLAAGIRLVQEGLSVLIVEAADTIGGGLRTQELIRPGYHHDVCSAMHPMALASPFMKSLQLEKFGLRWIHPVYPAAHPLEDEPAVVLYHDLIETAFHLNEDEKTYRDIIGPMVENWEALTSDFLGPLRIPSHPFKLASFGLKGMMPATLFKTRFKTERAKALFAGMAAHSILPLDAMMTSAIGLVFHGTAHTGGWPLAAGGSQSIADAMAACFRSLGGEIKTGIEIKSIKQLPSSQAVLFDLSPLQVSRIAGHLFPMSYNRKLRKFRYGPGVFKVDYILNEPVPWKDHHCKRAGTVHLGGRFDEVAKSEKQMSAGKHPEKPFVLTAQQSLFDSKRTPGEKHTLWTYCHVPNGSTLNMTEAIENQIERFAPGFRDVIDEKAVMNTKDFEQYNANYIGGDIAGGSQDLRQVFSRPVRFINPYSTPAKGVYLCSASTPPGGGVHGMCGYHAANLVLRKEFSLKKPDWKHGV
jgi:phytoene dehydrogenase-like protein